MDELQIITVEKTARNKLLITYIAPEAPPLDKSPRYKCTMHFEAGAYEWGKHECQLSLDQYMRILAITREGRV